MRLTKMLIALFAVTLFSFTTKTKEIHPGPWVFLGDKSVSWGNDHDVMNFGNIADGYRYLKLKVTEGPLKMYDMKVYFDNGEIQDVYIRARINNGGESRQIDLNGDIRHLDKIEFWYETKGFIRGKAKMNVYGRL